MPKIDVYKIDNNKIDGPVSSPIKSIQSGDVTINATASVTISLSFPVLPANSAIFIEKVCGTSGGTVSQYAVAGDITSSTQITISKNTTGYDIKVFWTVIEFNNVRSKQTGISNAGVTITVSKFDINKYLLVGSYTNTSTQTALASAYCQFKVLSSTSIIINTADLGTYINGHWQLIEFF